MVLRIIFLVLLPASFFHFGESLSAEWTQYSDSASLPMSKKYRDNLREKLQKINISELDETDREKVANLLNILNSGEDNITQSMQTKMSPFGKVFIMALLCAVGYYAYRKVSGLVYIPNAESIRQARESKYQ